MAALSRSLTRSISLLGRYRDKVRIPVCSSVSRRFLRLDHEEEIEQLFLKDSFDERLSKLKSNVGQVEPRLLGEAFKDVRDRPTRAKIAPAGKQNTGTSNDVGEDDIDIPLEEVYEDSIHESGCSHAIPLLKHYGVFQDLFAENVIFYADAEMNLRIAYQISEDNVLPVYTGNVIYPADTVSAPSISFNPKPDKSYSVLLVNLDGHLTRETGQYLHWYKVNMEGNDESGATCDYLPAVPVRGTGYHRYVFIHLQHGESLDLSLLPTIDHGRLASRDFDFASFYKSVSASVGATPVGVQFYQSTWDPSVRETFHTTLGMPEPAYEYDRAEKQHKPQIKYPHNQEFQLYLDRYRDRKEVAEEVLQEHISQYSPYKPLEEQIPPYPLARPTKPGLYAKHLPPTWIQKNTRHKFNKTGKYQYIYSDS